MLWEKCFIYVWQLVHPIDKVVWFQGCFPSGFAWGVSAAGAALKRLKVFQLYWCIQVHISILVVIEHSLLKYFTMVSGDIKSGQCSRPWDFSNIHPGSIRDQIQNLRGFLDSIPYKNWEKYWFPFKTGMPSLAEPRWYLKCFPIYYPPGHHCRFAEKCILKELSQQWILPLDPAPRGDECRLRKRPSCLPLKN